MKSVWNRKRVFALGALTMLLSSAAFAGVQLADGLRANAAACPEAPSCAPPPGTTTSTTNAPTAIPPAPAITHPTPARKVAHTVARKQLRKRVRQNVVTSTTRAPAPAPAPPAVSEPATCAEVVASVAWPPRWSVRCDGPRDGLLGLTAPAGVTDLFVRPDETMSRLRVVALHEAGHAWDLARLDPPRIAQWCAARGCDADRFFSGGVSSQGWAEPSGAEDWAASWDACHGGEYHRSYMGLAAPLPALCALQDTLVNYPH
jgi:hypothetical protein